MIYIFDTGAFIVISHYFPERFPSFWTKLNDYVEKGSIISVREVYNELSNHGNKPFLKNWLDKNKDIFRMPSEDEINFLSEIFQINHFRQLIGQEQILKGKPVADPFVIASARINKGCVVTEESFKINAAKIPNVCQHFSIDCTNIEAFMEREKWTF